MRTIAFLCLVNGVQSAALNLLHAVTPHNADKPPVFKTDEPPVFIASGFLSHSGNKSGMAHLSELGRRRHWTSSEDHASVKDACVKACGKGVDSSCIPECQVQLYECLDYDRKTTEGKTKYDDCEKTVVKTYSKFAATWEETHPYVTALLLRSEGKVTAADIDQAQDDCVKACGSGVDTSCVPECQVKMYQCLDNDRKVPEGLKKYEACEKKVIDDYKKFAEDWGETHPYLLAVGHHASAKDLHSIRDKCQADCGSASKKSCAPRCQTATYACLHIDASEAASEYATCTADVNFKVAKVEEASSTSAVELAAVEKACTGACGLGIDASCVPECQVQMYACEGPQYTACTEKVLSDYENFAADWNTAHPFLLAKRGHANAETLEEMQDGCSDACGVGVDSSSVPECQVQMYTCLDHNREKPEGAKKYKKCTAEVLAKYEKFADDWSKAHPYLLAVRRHVSSVELLRVDDKCSQACGKGVDSSCVPECQVEMYSCLDHDSKTKDGAKKYDECESKVTKEYQEFGKNWDAKHPY